MVKPGLLELRLEARPIYLLMRLERRRWLCEHGIHTGIYNVADLQIAPLIADRRIDVVCCVCGARWDASGERLD